MSEPPQNPQPGDDDRTDSDAPGPDLAKTPEGEAPAADRPPPYQGVYGAAPGQQPPAYGQPAPPHPGPAGPPGAASHPGQQPYGVPPQGQPAYGPPGYGPPPGYGSPQDMLAGRWARLGAAILDSLILAVLAVPVMLAAIRWDRFGEIVESGEPITDPMEIYNIPVLLTGYVIVFLIGFGYYTFTQVRWGQTLGKRACGIRLVTAADQSAVSWGQVAGRQAFVYAISILTVIANFAVPTASFVVSLLGLMDNAWILWDPRRQALHDKVAGTIVVKVTPWTTDPYAKS
ncbi:RDD family protein [Actinomadura algeriensis]|uniref:RDD family membrane protein YckC n=1 Tax=Actinomadura algeriensis TaxID=1679523 RepID=A0ABR9JVH9_9ACTN|nr:RDD family protein [Actinomadura algeriensis]MBE1534120.1 putative RDD family membrane protein YckC [Actinomadura algeriensis]